MLKEKKILFTGIVKDKNYFNDLLDLGIDVVFFPTIKINELNLTVDELNKINNAICYDYIIFTSVNSVKYFHKKISYKIEEINEASVKILAVGKKTKEIAEKKGFKNIEVPENFSSQGLIDYLAEKKIVNSTVLIPGSKLADKKLRNSLTNFGAKVDFIPIYDTITNNDIASEFIEKIKKTIFDFIVFTSPSTFKSFVKLLNIVDIGEYFSNTEIAAIGPVTKRAIEKYKVPVSVMPDTYSVKSLNKEIIKINNK